MIAEVFSGYNILKIKKMMCSRNRVNEMIIFKVCVCVCVCVCACMLTFTHSDIKNEVSALDSGKFM